MNDREPRLLDERHPIRADRERRHRVPVEIKLPLGPSSASPGSATPRVAGGRGRPARILVQVPLPRSFSEARTEAAGVSQ